MDEPRPPLPRTLRNRYRLDRILARRSGSTTYEGEDVRTGAPCVVKELSVSTVIREGSGALSYDGDDFTKVVELFEREAQVLAHLEHPGIPRLIDHFREEEDDDTRLYSVQERVEGRTLAEIVESGLHLTEDEVREICRRILGILDDLHRRSPPLVHRDIKPSNVIVSDDGSVHLVDFGSVRNALEPDVLDGQTIVGTYGYMPVEQYEGRAVPQSDLYALGMTLIYLLSHKDPTQIPRTGLSLVFREYVNVSEGFARIIEWMIAPAPEDRPPDAATLLRALDDPESVPGSMIPGWAGAFVRAIPVEQRRKAGVMLAGLAAFYGVALLLFFGLPRSPAGGFDPRESSGSGRIAGPEVRASDGVLTLDLDRDMVYVDRGWPMERSTGQTALPNLVSDPRSPLRLPEDLNGDDLRFGQIVLGNAEDNRFDFALVPAGGGWSMLLDRNNDEDLTNDGPALVNQGTGTVLATSATLVVPVEVDDGNVRRRRYQAWIWFNERDGGGLYGRMYSRHHYRGTFVLDGERFAATVFETRNHDGLYRDDGVCVDLDRDGACDETAELFYHGDLIEAPGTTVTLELLYP